MSAISENLRGNQNVFGRDLRRTVRWSHFRNILGLVLFVAARRCRASDRVAAAPGKTPVAHGHVLTMASAIASLPTQIGISEPIFEAAGSGQGI